MNYRINEFYGRTSHTSDTTVVIDLDMQDVISEILLTFEGTGSTYLNTSPLFDGITNIEIVDGSEVIYSLGGVESEALDWYAKGGRFNHNYNYAMNGGGYTRTLGLHFGRYRYDPMLALDPKMFKNLQLRVTLDIDGGGNAPATVYLTCNAVLFDEKVVSPQGFLSTKEVKMYTGASTVHEYTDLPVDYPLRALYLRAHLADTESNQCISNVKISEDQGKKVPFDLNSNALQRVVLDSYPKVTESYWMAPHTSVRYLYIAPTAQVTALGQPWAAAAADQGTTCYSGDGGKLYVITASAASNTQIHCQGHFPHATFEIPFGDKNDINDWFNPAGLRNLKADITGGASSVNHIIVQQLRTY